MARNLTPGGLDVEPEAVSEGFLLQEALRYRAALIEIEAALTMPGLRPAATCMRVLEISQQTLRAGEEAAGE